MRIHALFLVAALSLTAVPSLAQSTMPTPSAAMRQIESTARTQMLAALTPAHKALLATVAGQLATSTNPDYDAAARRLDSALSSAEKHAVVAAGQTAMTKLRSQMRSAHPMMEGHEMQSPDAGWMLLHLTWPQLGMPMMGSMMDRHA